MGMRLVFGVVLSFLFVQPLLTVYALEAERETETVAETKRVIINEIKLGGGSDPALKEYVTLFNADSSGISLDGWLLEYAKNVSADLDPTFCNATSWSGFDGVSVSATDLSGMTLASNTVSSPIARQLNDSGSGSLRLVDVSDPEHVVIHDTVGWGADAPCAEDSPAETPASGKSLIRYLSCESHMPVDNDNNVEDFAVNHEPRPSELGLLYKNDCTQEQAEDEDTAPLLSCEGVIISEILPNAAGSDTGKEFIELYNPTTDFIDLSGCGLELAGQDTTYLFEGVSLEPEAYQAFSDEETGITLPNASGGTIYLLSAANEELQAVEYPGELDDDVSWAWFGEDTWEQTYTPTPGAHNVSQPLKPCPAGEVRSEETGYCRVPESEAANELKPCAAHQERNPETNRCRSVASASTLKPCKPGQERNPQTNRCRSVASATANLKPCEPGQERNPETNRCRKVVAAATPGDSGSGIQDIETVPSSANAWWTAFAAVTLAAGYGLWEWRRDVRNFFSKFSKKMPVLSRN